MKPWPRSGKFGLDHRGERHADQELEAIARRLDERVDADVGRDLVRGGAERRRTATSAASAHAAARHVRFRSSRREHEFLSGRGGTLGDHPSALTSPIGSPIIGPIARGTPRTTVRRCLRASGGDVWASSTSKFVSAAVLAAGIAGLAIGQAVLQPKAEAQGASVQAPRFVVDPLWPKPLPNNWLLGWTIGVWVDEQDYVWIVHRGAGGLHNNEIGAELDPPIAECCRTAPPVLVFDPAGNLVRHWGGPGPGLRVAAGQPRHPRRLQRQRVDRRQRREGRAHPQVHQGRQVPDAGRPLRRQRRQQRPGEFRARRQDLGRSRRPTRPTSRTATRTSASPCSTPTPAR